MLKAVLFDHDGTLVNSEGLHFQHWQMVLAGHGIMLSAATYISRIAGLPTIDNARWLVDAFNMDTDYKTLERQKHEVTLNYLESSAFPLLPGALEAIGFFRGAGLKTGIVTGAKRIGANSTIAAHELAESIDVLVSAEDVENGKPAPDCYLLAMEKLGLQPADCLAFEDTAPGVAAASAAGLTCCAIPTEYSADHDFSPAAHTFGSMAEAMHWARGQYALS